MIKDRNELIRFYNPKGIGIEIGVLRGDFSEFILENCKDLQLYLLDCWTSQDNQIYKDVNNVEEYQHYLNFFYTLVNLKKHFKRCKIIKEFSDIAVNFFPNNFFDFIYIDANHSAEAVFEDLNIWYPKLKSGGLFAGDDYVPTCGVINAVDKFAEKYNIKILNTGEHSNWYFIKP